MTAPIPDCPAPDYPMRERAWTAEQLEQLAKRQREVFAKEYAAMASPPDAYEVSGKSYLDLSDGY